MSAREVADLLRVARSVVVVPGYGLGRAQGQHALRTLDDALTARGTAVHYAVHPVAGRVPGHVNALLDAAGIAWHRVLAADAVETALAAADVALVVGADDVVNTSAAADPTSPLFGLAPIPVTRAWAIVVLRRGVSRGFAGVTNPLFADPRALTLLGDAAAALAAVHAALVGDAEEPVPRLAQAGHDVADIVQPRVDPDDHHRY